MKIHLKPAKWNHEPWTIVEQQGVQSRRTSGIWYHAFNPVTGDRKPSRTTYDEAMGDIPQSPNAEPWGL